MCVCAGRSDACYEDPALAVSLFLLQCTSPFDFLRVWSFAQLTLLSLWCGAKWLRCSVQRRRDGMLVAVCHLNTCT